jgi:hypothetical protein
MFKKLGNDQVLWAICRLAGTTQMHNMPSERAFEIVESDLSVTADGRPNKAKTNVRLGCTLQRLFEPVTDEQLDELDHLLMLLDRRASERWK